jgi:exodeoxyribonuclease V alpha subunit
MIKERGLNQMPASEQAEVTGQVRSIFFQNPTNFFKIILLHIEKISVAWDDDDIVVTGTFGEVKQDDTLKCVGHLVNHPKYGHQFAADRYEKETPTSKAGLIEYLSEKQFKGIGPKTAERIVDRLGTDAITKIVKDPNVLAGVGLAKTVRDDFVDALKRTYGMERVMLQLNAWGVRASLASTIYQRYQEATLEKLGENPYRLVTDVMGVSFRRADSIALSLEIGPTDSRRLQCAITAAFAQLNNDEGAIYTNAELLLRVAEHILSGGVMSPLPTLPELANVLTQMVQDKTVVSESGRLYLASYYEAEWQIASGLHTLSTAPLKPKLTMTKVKKTVLAAAKQLHIAYDDSQVAALTTALTQPVFLLTGGPGTGKTTVIRGLIAAYAELHQVSLDPKDYTETPFPIQLAAPTGRAAKRMTELTGLPAGTIHRLLGLTGRDRSEMFKEPGPLTAKLIIIDEMSMVDMFLFRQLVRAVTPGTQLVLVGDKDQLPSVGPGQIFADLLNSGVLPAAYLTKIHRQAAGSSIVALAHTINEGDTPPELFKNQADRSFFAVSAGQVPEVIGQIVTRAHLKGFTPMDIQILAPMYRGPAGVNHLNEVVQEILNPSTPDNTKEIVVGMNHYRIGDKVLQLVNDPERNVFNGEIGRITAITPAKQDKQHRDRMTVAFDETEVDYGRGDFNHIAMAYATSIHKAQGSEFPLVILPVVHEYGRMLERNLLYTAITRAERLLIMVGEEGAVRRAIETPGAKRTTTLPQRLQQQFGAVSKEDEPANPSTEPAEISQAPAPPLTYKMILQHVIDPMIGMAHVTPQDFMVQDDDKEG